MKHALKEKATSGAECNVEQARASAADCRILSAHDDFLFLRQNDYWIIRYDGHTAVLKSMRGLRYLAVLLCNSGREFHVRELLAGAIDISTLRAAGAMHVNVIGERYLGLPALDAQTKGECKRRLDELRQALREAERFNDPHRKTEAQNEIQAITDYLTSAVGLGGRDRRTSSDTERARSAVTKCIRKGIQKINSAIPSLGYHLATRIKTGYFCSYNPHPDRPVAWKF